jgi:hypothetical protein
MVVKRCLLLSLVLALAAVGAAQWDPLTKIKADFYAWDMILQSMAVDYVAFPRGDDIQAVGAFLKSLYWEEPILYDPWGNLYRYSSNGKSYSLASPGPDGKPGTTDDLIAHGVVIEPMTPPEEKPTQTASVSFSSPPSPRSPDTDVRLSKSGSNDILFSWTGAGTQYDIVGATDTKFLNTYLVLNNGAGPTYTYTNALKNPKTVEFFDVTDENEVNHGADANGYLPPVPPNITSASSTPYVGGSVTLTGTDFSDVADNNIVCFGGGLCLRPTSATTSSVSFTIPPGGISGPVTVADGLLVSTPYSLVVQLEDPTYPVLTIRTLGFAGTTGDFYTADLYSGNKVYRHYYDNGQGKWVRAPIILFADHQYYGSTKTDRFKHIFFADGFGTTSLSTSTYVLTDPFDVNMAACKALGVPGSGRSVRAAGAAPDPNPQSLVGRDVVYFAFDDALNGKYIYKVEVNAGGCGNILDTDYGNRLGAWYWNAIVGMSVDPKTGDLYVAERLTTSSSVVKVIRNDGSETLEVVKTGFNNVFGVDAWREPGSDYGVLMIADFAAGRFWTVPLDNPTVASELLATGSTTRTIAGALTTYVPTEFNAQDLARFEIAHNDGGAIKLKREPYLIADSYSMDPVPIWISSPDPLDKNAPFQGNVRLSYPTGSDYSTLRIKAWWSDNKPRDICASLGDALSTAPYDTVPGPMKRGCGRSWLDARTKFGDGSCDNAEPFNEFAGVGTSTANDALVDCRSSCGTSSNPCVFNFRISQQYSGDNYRVYFTVPSGSVISSTLYTAWKRILLEQDKMCRRGGLLFENASNGQTSISLAKYLNTRVDNVQLGDIIRVLDAGKPYEPAHDRACVAAITDTDPNFVVLTLAEPSDCLTLKPLTFSYTASPWSFLSGNSAGVCAEGSGFFTPDTSQLNKRDRSGPYDDAFSSFIMPQDGTGVVPYLPQAFFDNLDSDPMFRFQQYWFKHRNQEPPVSTNLASNYWHMTGVSKHSQWGGVSRPSSNAAFAFIAVPEDTATKCNFQGPPARACEPIEIQYSIRHICAHECCHLFGYNADEVDPDFAWCWNAPGATCPHPDLTPPNSGYTDQWCGMSPIAVPDHDKGMAMQTDDVTHFDCALLNGTSCWGEPLGRPAIRTQEDPQ